MTPPKTLPQDTLPFSSAKLNFFIIVRFLINTMICISIKKTASKEYLFDEYLSFQQTFVLKNACIYKVIFDAVIYKSKNLHLIYL